MPAVNVPSKLLLVALLATSAPEKSGSMSLLLVESSLTWLSKLDGATFRVPTRHGPWSRSKHMSTSGLHWAELETRKTLPELSGSLSAKTEDG